MSIGDIKSLLGLFDSEETLPVGFHNPHAYRGYYHEAAVELAYDVKVSDMLADLDALLSQTFQGWKGGDYRYDDWTTLHIVTQEGRSGDVALVAMLCLGDQIPVRRWDEDERGLQLLKNFLHSD